MVHAVFKGEYILFCIPVNCTNYCGHQTDCHNVICIYMFVECDCLLVIYRMGYVTKYMHHFHQTEIFPHLIQTKVARCLTENPFM